MSTYTLSVVINVERDIDNQGFRNLSYLFIFDLSVWEVFNLHLFLME